MTIWVLDINHADLFDGPEDRMRVAVADLSYSGRNRQSALRSAALRAVPGATHSHLVRRWRWYGCPAISFEVWDDQ